MKLISILIFLLIAAADGCEKSGFSKNLPDCIQQKIAVLKSEKIRNPPAEIWQYQYHGKTVYFIPAYCCDLPSQLYDENCNLICSPDGGFTGKGDGKCKDFFIARTEGKRIWKDDRK